MSFSVVTYHNEVSELTRLLVSVKNCGAGHTLTLVDNGGDTALAGLAASFGYRYLNPGKNIGFGAGHNLVLKQQQGLARYHVIINPDVYFEEDSFKKTLAFLDKNEEVGACVPKVLYPGGELQHLCKLVPTPFDLFARRFVPGFLKGLFKGRMQRYEFLDYDYHQNLEVPILSGCCLTVKDAVFEKTGFFDERFFLYLEDVDLNRRIHQHFRTMHFAGAEIYHDYRKASYKNKNGLKLHLRSAIQYFNKWGWFFDQQRSRMNRQARLANRSKRARR